MKNRNLRFVVSALALSCALIVLACQKSQLAEYKKYENDAAVPRITIEEAKKDVDAGNAVIVDSRGDGAFKQERIAGSINMPMGSTEDKLATLPKDKKIIVYCS
ncbi:MAG: rhodanese-like domain-containing protein [Pyrinomonadaceae bacterium]